MAGTYTEGSSKPLSGVYTKFIATSRAGSGGGGNGGGGPGPGPEPKPLIAMFLSPNQVIYMRMEG